MNNDNNNSEDTNEKRWSSQRRTPPPPPPLLRVLGTSMVVTVNQAAEDVKSHAMTSD